MAKHQYLYFYPRSPCGERRPMIPTTPPAKRISIHALLAESDPVAAHFGRRKLKFLSTLSLRRATSSAQFVGADSGYFYPRSPCGERLWYTVVGGVNHAISIHALLAESDASIRRFCSSARLFLSTLSLRRATLHSAWQHRRWWYFYPRSPCGERPLFWGYIESVMRFLSTLSLRRATMSPAL